MPWSDTLSTARNFSNCRKKPRPKTVVASYEGDAALGAVRAEEMCGRCHVVDAAKRMNSIGSTPSFFALRSLTDWEDRFQTFYVLNPHPAFTQIKDVTPPFPVDRPSPIVPVVMTLDDMDCHPCLRCRACTG